MCARPLHLVALALALPTVQAQVVYPLAADRDVSMRTGADALIAAHWASIAFTDRLLPPRLIEERTTLPRGFGVFYRLATVTLITGVADYMPMLIQHEVFGHGSRVLGLGHSIRAVELNLPPPYGSGSGWISYRFDSSASAQERAVITTGGVEGAAVLAEGWRARMAQRGRMHYREAAAYLTAFHNLTGYVLGTGEREGGGHDIARYLRYLDEEHNFAIAWNEGRPVGPLTRRQDLRRLVLINLLDPYTWAALYASARYVVRGRSMLTLPSLNVRGATYLPTIQLGLSPFGAEVLAQHLLMARRLVELRLRYGAGPWGRFGGSGLHVAPLAARDRWRLDLDADVWRQPEVLSGSDVRRPSRRWGAGSRLTGYLWLHAYGGLYLQVGLKTRGYVPGDPIGGGAYGRFGLSLREATGLPR